MTLLFDLLLTLYFLPVLSINKPDHDGSKYQFPLEEKDSGYGKIRNRLTNATITVDSCGLSSVKDVPLNDKIIAGSDAITGQFPYQVLLRLRRKDRRVMTCGGSIINDRWVLTAAHCVSNENVGEPYVIGVEVTAGITNKEDKSSTVQKRSVDCVLQHEKWIGLKGGFANDLALLRLPTDNPLNMTYKSGGLVNGICFPNKAKTPFEYLGKARVSGWGLTSSGKSATLLRYTDVGLIDDKKCHKNSFPFPIVSSMLCQGIDRTSPCYGDSGGPLVIRIRGRYTQIGVVSTGPSQCGNDFDPNGIYTQVSYFLNWIEDTISRNSLNNCFGYKLNSFD